jgi:creatinine amidohydrolase
MKKIFLSDMTHIEVKERLKVTDIAVVPIGSTEQHGPHLPLKTDIFIPFEIAKRAAEKVIDKVDLVITPPLSFGYCPSNIPFSGSISLTSTTFLNLVRDVCNSLIYHGFRRIVLFNGHGTNRSLLASVIFDIMHAQEQTANLFLISVSWWDLISDVLSKVTENWFCHSAEVETSIALALGEPVNMKIAPTNTPKPPLAKWFDYNLLGVQKICLAWPRLDVISKSGVMGDATKANKKKGEIILNAAVDGLADLLIALKSTKTWNVS